MMPEPEHCFFSVVVPTYNRSDMVVDTVKNILIQDFRNFEIIVIDDGSTDETENALKEFRSERLQYVYQKNAERGEARNNGYRISKGRYVAFCDSDDLWHENHLSVLYKAIVTQNFPALIAAKFESNRNGRIYKTAVNHLSEGYYDYKLFLRGNPIACHFAVNKSAHPTLFLSDRKYAAKEDWLFLIENTRRLKLYLVDQITITLMDHDDRSMRKEENILIEKTFLSLKYITENLNLTSEEVHVVSSHAYYFSAVQYYALNKRSKGLNYLWKSIRLDYFSKRHFLLLLRLLLGRKLLLKFK